jgi:hypothetical protein
MAWRQRLPDRKDLLIVALLFLLPTISFAELLFFDKALYHRDIVMIHYPLGVLKGRLLDSGQLPLWNPYIEFGFPQLADQDVIGLHPLNLIFMLPLRPHLALSWFVVAQYILAGVLSYIMARVLRLSRIGALIVALTFALSGYMMAQLTNLPIITGSVWLPLIFSLFVKTIETRRLTFAILCGASIALQIITAHPQVVFYTLLMLAAYGLYKLVGLWWKDTPAAQERTRRTAVLIGLMAITILAGLLLAAVQILPTWELKSLSPRATGLSYAMMTVFSLPPYSPLTLLFPTLLGNPLIGYRGEGLFEELHVYAGILPLMLVPWAWAKRKRDGNLAFFAILAAVSLLLALGHYTPLYRILVHVPGFNFFRVPARWLLTVTFSLSILAGYGYDVLVGSHGHPQSRRFALFWQILTWVNIAISVVLLAGLALGPRAAQGLAQLRAGLPAAPFADRLWLLAHELVRHPLIRPADSLSTTLASLNPVLPFVLFSNTGFLLIYLWSREWIKESAFQVVLLGLITVDLLLVGGTTINPVRKATYYERPIGSTVFLQQNAGLHRVYSFSRRDKVEYLLEDMPAAYEIYGAQGHVSQLALSRYQAFLDELEESDTLLNLAGVKYVLAEKGTELPGRTSAYVAGNLEVYENQSVLPRAFVVYEAEVLPSEQAVMERMLGAGFDPSRTVLLEEEPMGMTDQAVPPPGPAKDEVRESSQTGEDALTLTSSKATHLPLLRRGWPPVPMITVYSPHQVVVEAELQESGFLVLSDTYYPGWKVLVNGQEGRIYLADYLFRAVSLPPGRHTVEFRYAPASFRTGLAVTLATGALCLAIIVSSSLSRRQRKT